MGTNVYLAKDLLIDRLRLLSTSPGHPLEGVQVTYAYPGQHAKSECIYGGFAQFEQPVEDEAVSGHDTISLENALVTIHIQVQAPLTSLVVVPDDLAQVAATVVRDCDRRAGELLAGVRLGLRDMNSQPDTMSFGRIERGQASYWLAEDMVGSRLACQVGVSSQVGSRI